MRPGFRGRETRLWIRVRPDLLRHCGAAVLFACWLMLAHGGARSAGLPVPYRAIVVQPTGLPTQAEFDLRPAIDQAGARRSRCTSTSAPTTALTAVVTRHS